MESKRCSGCKQPKSLDEFGLDSRVPSGRQSRCRDCDAKAKSGKYRNMEPDAKRSFLTNLKTIGKRHRQKKIASGICVTCTRKAVPGFRACRRHMKAHRDRQAFRIKRAREQGFCGTCGCRPAIYGKRQCESCVARNDAYWLALRKEIQAAYGGRCACCGEVGPLFLTVDHKLNNGAAHRRALKLSGAGHTFYLWLKKQGFPQDEFQLLCMTCNWGKKMNGGVCPHVSDPTGHPLPEFHQGEFK